MSLAENPHFGNVERAPYQLGQLLTQLPPDFSRSGHITPDSRQIAEAAMRHAENAAYAVMDGLEALGQVMFVAGSNEENHVDGRTIANLGYLVKHLAVELQFLHHIEEEIRENLAARDVAAKSKGGK